MVPGSYEANSLVEPLLNSHIMFVVEVGWFALVFLLPYLLAQNIRRAEFQHLYVMGFVFGFGRLMAAIHNFQVLASCI